MLLRPYLSLAQVAEFDRHLLRQLRSCDNATMLHDLYAEAGHGILRPFRFLYKSRIHLSVDPSLLSIDVELL